MDDLRVGNGFDVHPFARGRELILGGKTIEYPLGLAGHSDADVLLHAVIDALAGAAGLGDIGMLFPDSDAAYHGISSIELLTRVRGMLLERRVSVLNIDAIVICQEPRIAPHVPEMKRNIASALDMDVDRVSIKGKSTEGLGFTGNREGIASYAVSLVIISK
jgi:2-C-methyl-D-erythritol 2,4-cyclodiphosphate synthase